MFGELSQILVRILLLDGLKRLLDVPAARYVAKNTNDRV